ncbi:methyltransferase domain-containing protein [Ferrovibrio sp.]|uniref:methyltransferase domain-containing protein n=1 Tax=Ferrovibrio sp. TaxID=1917215 RepID=UPI0025BFCA04|nr:methyltransferase domain-containing protein [Ferrovibrio sp.]MBX3455753.1 methyltransferase domain-containing protein [Ferrovibrio sp.]
MTETMLIFDRAAKRLHRARAAHGFAAHDFLHREIAERLLDRLADIRREFPLALLQGASPDWLQPLLAGRFGIQRLVGMDMAPTGQQLVADEDLLPLAEGRFDLALCLLNLHWVNDLPGALVQLRRALKPDGLLLAALFGGDTLTELRQSWLAAESELEGGAGPHVSPMVATYDGAALLQRTGFALPVADAERITVTFRDPFALMRDLRGMGEANAVLGRRKGFTRRASLLRMAEIYAERFGLPDGRIPATFEVVMLTGWSPDASQQQPLRPGEAKLRLADALGAVEHKVGKG